MQQVLLHHWSFVKQTGVVGWKVKVDDNSGVTPVTYHDPHLFFAATDDESPMRLYLYLKQIVEILYGFYAIVGDFEDQVISLNDEVASLTARVSALENP